MNNVDIERIKLDIRSQREMTRLHRMLGWMIVAQLLSIAAVVLLVVL